MDPALVEHARTTLEAEHARLRAELDAEVESPGQMTYGSQAAAASQVFAQQRDLALREKAEKELALVDAALSRLEALPWAAYCIACQKLVAEGR